MILFIFATVFVISIATLLFALKFGHGLVSQLLKFLGIRTTSVTMCYWPPTIRLRGVSLRSTNQADHRKPQLSRLLSFLVFPLLRPLRLPMELVELTIEEFDLLCFQPLQPIDVRVKGVRAYLATWSGDLWPDLVARSLCSRICDAVCSRQSSGVATDGFFLHLWTVMWRTVVSAVAAWTSRIISYISRMCANFHIVVEDVGLEVCMTLHTGSALGRSAFSARQNISGTASPHYVSLSPLLNRHGSRRTNEQVVFASSFSRFVVQRSLTSRTVALHSAHLTLYSAPAATPPQTQFPLPAVNTGVCKDLVFAVPYVGLSASYSDALVFTTKSVDGGVENKDIVFSLTPEGFRVLGSLVAISSDPLLLWSDASLSSRPVAVEATSKLPVMRRCTAAAWLRCRRRVQCELLSKLLLFSAAASLGVIRSRKSSVQCSAVGESEKALLNALCRQTSWRQFVRAVAMAERYAHVVSARGGAVSDASALSTAAFPGVGIRRFLRAFALTLRSRKVQGQEISLQVPTFHFILCDRSISFEARSSRAPPSTSGSAVPQVHRLMSASALNFTLTAGAPRKPAGRMFGFRTSSASQRVCSLCCRDHFCADLALAISMSSVRLNCPIIAEHFLQVRPASSDGVRQKYRELLVWKDLSIRTLVQMDSEADKILLPPTGKRTGHQITLCASGGSIHGTLCVDEVLRLARCFKNSISLAATRYRDLKYADPISRSLSLRSNIVIPDSHVLKAEHCNPSACNGFFCGFSAARMRGLRVMRGMVPLASSHLITGAALVFTSIAIDIVSDPAPRTVYRAAPLNVSGVPASARAKSAGQFNSDLKPCETCLRGTPMPQSLTVSPLQRNYCPPTVAPRVLVTRVVAITLSLRYRCRCDEQCCCELTKGYHHCWVPSRAVAPVDPKLSAPNQLERMLLSPPSVPVESTVPTPSFPRSPGPCLDSVSPAEDPPIALSAALGGLSSALDNASLTLGVGYLNVSTPTVVRHTVVGSHYPRLRPREPVTLFAAPHGIAISCSVHSWSPQGPSVAPVSLQAFSKHIVTSFHAAAWDCGSSCFRNLMLALMGKSVSGRVLSVPPSAEPHIPSKMRAFTRSLPLVKVFLGALRVDALAYAQSVWSGWLPVCPECETVPSVCDIINVYGARLKEERNKVPIGLHHPHKPDIPGYPHGCLLTSIVTSAPFRVSLGMYVEGTVIDIGSSTHGGLELPTAEACARAAAQWLDGHDVRAFLACFQSEHLTILRPSVSASDSTWDLLDDTWARLWDRVRPMMRCVILCCPERARHIIPLMTTDTISTPPIPLCTNDGTVLDPSRIQGNATSIQIQLIARSAMISLCESSLASFESLFQMSMILSRVTSGAWEYEACGHWNNESEVCHSPPRLYEVPGDVSDSFFIDGLPRRIVPGASGAAPCPFTHPCSISPISPRNCVSLIIDSQVDFVCRTALSVVDDAPASMKSFLEGHPFLTLHVLHPSFEAPSVASCGAPELRKTVEPCAVLCVSVGQCWTAVEVMIQDPLLCDDRQRRYPHMIGSPMSLHRGARRQMTVEAADPVSSFLRMSYISSICVHPDMQPSPSALWLSFHNGACVLHSPSITALVSYMSANACPATASCEASRMPPPANLTSVLLPKPTDVSLHPSYMIRMSKAFMVPWTHCQAPQLPLPPRTFAPLSLCVDVTDIVASVPVSLLGATDDCFLALSALSSSLGDAVRPALTEAHMICTSLDHLRVFSAPPGEGSAIPAVPPPTSSENDSFGTLCGETVPDLALKCHFPEMFTPNADRSRFASSFSFPALDIDAAVVNYAPRFYTISLEGLSLAKVPIKMQPTSFPSLSRIFTSCRERSVGGWFSLMEPTDIDIVIAYGISGVARSYLRCHQATPETQGALPQRIFERKIPLPSCTKMVISAVARKPVVFQLQSLCDWCLLGATIAGNFCSAAIPKGLMPFYAEPRSIPTVLPVGARPSEFEVAIDLGPSFEVIWQPTVVSTVSLDVPMRSAVSDEGFHLITSGGICLQWFPTLPGTSLGLLDAEGSPIATSPAVMACSPAAGSKLLALGKDGMICTSVVRSASLDLLFASDKASGRAPVCRSGIPTAEELHFHHHWKQRHYFQAGEGFHVSEIRHSIPRERPNYGDVIQAAYLTMSKLEPLSCRVSLVSTYSTSRASLDEQVSFLHSLLAPPKVHASSYVRLSGFWILSLDVAAMTDLMWGKLLPQAVYLSWMGMFGIPWLTPDMVTPLHESYEVEAVGIIPFGLYFPTFDGASDQQVEESTACTLPSIVDEQLSHDSGADDSSAPAQSLHVLDAVIRRVQESVMEKGGVLFTVHGTKFTRDSSKFVFQSTDEIVNDESCRLAFIAESLPPYHVLSRGYYISVQQRRCGIVEASLSNLISSTVRRPNRIRRKCTYMGATALGVMGIASQANILKRNSSYKPPVLVFAAPTCPGGSHLVPALNDSVPAFQFSLSARRGLQCSLRDGVFAMSSTGVESINPLKDLLWISNQWGRPSYSVIRAQLSHHKSFGEVKGFSLEGIASCSSLSSDHLREVLPASCYESPWFSDPADPGVLPAYDITKLDLSNCGVSLVGGLAPSSFRSPEEAIEDHQFQLYKRPPVSFFLVAQTLRVVQNSPVKTLANVPRMSEKPLYYVMMNKILATVCCSSELAEVPLLTSIAADPLCDWCSAVAGDSSANFHLPQHDFQAGLFALYSMCVPAPALSAASLGRLALVPTFGSPPPAGVTSTSSCAWWRILEESANSSSFILVPTQVPFILTYKDCHTSHIIVPASPSAGSPTAPDGLSISLARDTVRSLTPGTIGFSFDTAVTDATDDASAPSCSHEQQRVMPGEYPNLRVPIMDTAASLGTRRSRVHFVNDFVPTLSTHENPCVDTTPDPLNQFIETEMNSLETQAWESVHKIRVVSANAEPGKLLTCSIPPLFVTLHQRSFVGMAILRRELTFVSSRRSASPVLGFAVSIQLAALSMMAYEEDPIRKAIPIQLPTAPPAASSPRSFSRVSSRNSVPSELSGVPYLPVTTPPANALIGLCLKGLTVSSNSTGDSGAVALVQVNLLVASGSGSCSGTTTVGKALPLPRMASSLSADLSPSPFYDDQSPRYGSNDFGQSRASDTLNIAQRFSVKAVLETQVSLMKEAPICALTSFTKLSGDNTDVPTEVYTQPPFLHFRWSTDSISLKEKETNVALQSDEFLSMTDTSSTKIHVVLFICPRMVASLESIIPLSGFLARVGHIASSVSAFDINSKQLKVPPPSGVQHPLRNLQLLDLKSLHVVPGSARVRVDRCLAPVAAIDIARQTVITVDADFIISGDMLLHPRCILHVCGLKSNVIHLYGVDGGMTISLPTTNLHHIEASDVLTPGVRPYIRFSQVDSQTKRVVNHLPLIVVDPGVTFVLHDVVLTAPLESVAFVPQGSYISTQRVHFDFGLDIPVSPSKRQLDVADDVFLPAMSSINDQSARKLAILPWYFNTNWSIRVNAPLEIIVVPASPSAHETRGLSLTMDMDVAVVVVAGTDIPSSSPAEALTFPPAIYVEGSTSSTHIGTITAASLVALSNMQYRDTESLVDPHTIRVRSDPVSSLLPIRTREAAVDAAPKVEPPPKMCDHLLPWLTRSASITFNFPPDVSVRIAARDLLFVCSVFDGVNDISAAFLRSVRRLPPHTLKTHSDNQLHMCLRHVSGHFLLGSRVSDRTATAENTGDEPQLSHMSMFDDFRGLPCIITAGHRIHLQPETAPASLFSRSSPSLAPARGTASFSSSASFAAAPNVSQEVSMLEMFRVATILFHAVATVPQTFAQLEQRLLLKSPSRVSMHPLNVAPDIPMGTIVIVDDALSADLPLVAVTISAMNLTASFPILDDGIPDDLQCECPDDVSVSFPLDSASVPNDSFVFGVPFQRFFYSSVLSSTTLNLRVTCSVDLFHNAICVWEPLIEPFQLTTIFAWGASSSATARALERRSLRALENRGSVTDSAALMTAPELDVPESAWEAKWDNVVELEPTQPLPEEESLPEEREEEVMSDSSSGESERFDLPNCPVSATSMTFLCPPSGSDDATKSDVLSMGSLPQSPEVAPLSPPKRPAERPVVQFQLSPAEIEPRSAEVAEQFIQAAGATDSERQAAMATLLAPPLDEESTRHTESILEVRTSVLDINVTSSLARTIALVMTKFDNARAAANAPVITSSSSSESVVRESVQRSGTSAEPSVVRRFHPFEVHNAIGVPLKIRTSGRVPTTVTVFHGGRKGLASNTVIGATSAPAGGQQGAEEAPISKATLALSGPKANTADTLIVPLRYIGSFGTAIVGAPVLIEVLLRAGRRQVKCRSRVTLVNNSPLPLQIGAMSAVAPAAQASTPAGESIVSDESLSSVSIPVDMLSELVRIIPQYNGVQYGAAQLGIPYSRLFTLAGMQFLIVCKPVAGSSEPSSPSPPPRAAANPVTPLLILNRPVALSLSVGIRHANGAFDTTLWVNPSFVIRNYCGADLTVTLLQSSMGTSVASNTFGMPGGVIREDLFPVQSAIVANRSQLGATTIDPTADAVMHLAFAEPGGTVCRTKRPIVVYIGLRSSSGKFVKKRQRKQWLPQSIVLEDAEGEAIVLIATYEKDPVTHLHTVSIFAKFWVINSSDFPCRLVTTNRRAHLTAGQSASLGIVPSSKPFLIGNTDTDAPDSAIHVSLGSTAEWSGAIRIFRTGVMGYIECLATGQGGDVRTVAFSVDSPREGGIIAEHTRVLYIEPRWLLSNRIGVPLKVFPQAMNRDYQGSYDEANAPVIAAVDSPVALDGFQEEGRSMSTSGPGGTVVLFEDSSSNHRDTHSLVFRYCSQTPEEADPVTGRIIDCQWSHPVHISNLSETVVNVRYRVAMPAALTTVSDTSAPQRQCTVGTQTNLDLDSESDNENTGEVVSRMAVVRVHVFRPIQRPTFYIVLEHVSHPPLCIENFTSSTVSLHQIVSDAILKNARGWRGKARTKEKVLAAPKHELPPFTSRPLAWDFPTERPLSLQLSITLPTGAKGAAPLVGSIVVPFHAQADSAISSSRHRADLARHLTCEIAGQMFHITIYNRSSTRRTTFVRITDTDQDTVRLLAPLFDDSHKTSQLRVCIRGLGISLVDSDGIYPTQELAYLSLHSVDTLLRIGDSAASLVVQIARVQVDDMSRNAVHKVVLSTVTPHARRGVPFAVVKIDRLFDTLLPDTLHLHCLSVNILDTDVKIEDSFLWGMLAFTRSVQKALSEGRVASSSESDRPLAASDRAEGSRYDPVPASASSLSTLLSMEATVDSLHISRMKLYLTLARRRRPTQDPYPALIGTYAVFVRSCTAFPLAIEQFFLQNLSNRLWLILSMLNSHIYGGILSQKTKLLSSMMALGSAQNQLLGGPVKGQSVGRSGISVRRPVRPPRLLPSQQGLTVYAPNRAFSHVKALPEIASTTPPAVDADVPLDLSTDMRLGVTASGLPLPSWCLRLAPADTPACRCAQVLKAKKKLGLSAMLIYVPNSAGSQNRREDRFSPREIAHHCTFLEAHAALGNQPELFVQIADYLRDYFLEDILRGSAAVKQLASLVEASVKKCTQCSAVARMLVEIRYGRLSFMHHQFPTESPRSPTRIPHDSPDFLDVGHESAHWASAITNGVTFAPLSQQLPALRQLLDQGVLNPIELAHHAPWEICRTVLLPMEFHAISLSLLATYYASFNGVLLA